MNLDQLARQDIQILKEFSLLINKKIGLHELFNLYLLTLMGRFRLRRAAIYIPTSTHGHFRFFVSKGHPAVAPLPETIEVGPVPSDPPPAFARMGYTLGRAISWKSARVDVHLLVYLAPHRAAALNPSDEALIDLISNQVSHALQGYLGEVIQKLQDLGRREAILKTGGRGKRGVHLSREDLLDSRNLQTLQDIAFRFKGGVTLHELFNTYLLTLMGRLRLKRAAIYVSTLPATQFKLFLRKGNPAKGDMPEGLTADEMPEDRIWIYLKDYPKLNRGNVFGRMGFSLVWILSRAKVMVFMGADRDMNLSAADVRFIEILNHQIEGMLNLLDNFSHADQGTLLEWDANLQTMMDEGRQTQGPAPKDSVGCRILFRPSHKVGGDFYDFYRFGEDRIGIVLADVVGHGIPAAMWTHAIRDNLKGIAEEHLEPAAVLERLNAILLKNQKSEIPVSVCYGILHLGNLTFTYSCAGIDYPLLFRPAEGRVFELPAGGLFLGCIPNIRFSQETVSLKKNDLLMLYTDGLEALMSEDWKEKTLGSLSAEIRNHKSLLDISHQILNQMADEPECGDDDKTAILISPNLAAAGSFPEFKNARDLRLPSDVRHLPTLRTFLGNMLRSCGGVTADDTFAVEFTTEDAVVNAIQHGYPGEADRTIDVSAVQEKDRLSIVVSDAGRGFDFCRDRLPTFSTEEELYRSSGRGLYMMFQLMDHVEIESKFDAGTTVRLVKNINHGV